MSLGGLAKTRYGHVARPRWLQLHEDEDGLDPGCKERLRNMASDNVDKVMRLTMTALAKCHEDQYSMECHNMSQRVDRVEDEFTLDCKLSGDICTLKSVLEDGTLLEEKDICMPKACHETPELANMWAEENLSPEGLQHMCAGCTTTFTCGAGGEEPGANERTASPDMTFTDNSEKDGEVHPQVDVWNPTTGIPTLPPTPTMPPVPTMPPLETPAPVAFPTFPPLETLPSLPPLPPLLPPSDQVPFACKERLRNVASEVIGKVMQVTMQALAKCHEDQTSQECKNMTKKVDTVEDDFTAGCKLSGDICTVTEKMKDGEDVEEKDICMPKACHANPHAANAWAEENLSPGGPKAKPANSTTTIVCGNGESGEAEAAKPDLKFPGSNETDGSVHPEVEVWKP